jgi:hypothetical protein
METTYGLLVCYSCTSYNIWSTEAHSGTLESENGNNICTATRAQATTSYLYTTHASSIINQSWILHDGLRAGKRNMHLPRRFGGAGSPGRRDWDGWRRQRGAGDDWMSGKLWPWYGARGPGETAIDWARKLVANWSSLIVRVLNTNASCLCWNFFTSELLDYSSLSSIWTPVVFYQDTWYLDHVTVHKRTKFWEKTSFT